MTVECTPLDTCVQRDSARKIKVVENPTGSAGQALTDNFKEIAYRQPPCNYDLNNDPPKAPQHEADYCIGSRWLNNNIPDDARQMWICVDDRTSRAVWVPWLRWFDNTKWLDDHAQWQMLVVDTHFGADGEVRRITVDPATTEAPLILVPKGTAQNSAILHGRHGQAPGGNPRGSKAVDWQNTRANNNQVASGERSFIAAGQNNTAIGANSHAQGFTTSASEISAHAEGASTIAAGSASHAEGLNTRALFGAQFAHVEGWETTANSTAAHVEGRQTEVSAGAEAAHAEGYDTIAAAPASHVEGYQTRTVAGASYAHAEGRETIARAEQSHAEGYQTQVDVNASAAHAEGHGNLVRSLGAHVEGVETLVQEDADGGHAEGYCDGLGNLRVDRTGFGAHAGGFATDGVVIIAAKNGAQATGAATENGVINAEGSGAHARGNVTGLFSTVVATGSGAQASGLGSLGGVIRAQGPGAHACGMAVEGHACCRGCGDYKLG